MLQEEDVLWNPGLGFELELDTVIMSLGTAPNPLISSTTIGLDINKRKCIIADEETGQTSKDGVYAGGDAVTGQLRLSWLWAQEKQRQRALMSFKEQINRSSEKQKKGRYDCSEVRPAFHF